MPKPSQEGSRQRNNTPNSNQPSRSNSIDSQRTRTVRFQKNSKGGRNTNNRDKNCRGSKRQITNSNPPDDNNNSSKGPCKHCKHDNHVPNECKACFKCGKTGHFRNECRSNILIKLRTSAPKGQRADRGTPPGSQIETFNSVVDHRSVFIQIKSFDRIIEAICGSGASVSCLSSEAYDSFKLEHSLKLEPALRQLKAANQFPIETRGIVRLPISLGGRKFEHNFHVLAKPEADCLIGLDFLEDHQCDPLFSKKKLRVNDDTFVTLYHKVYTIQTDQVFRVVSTDNVWIPAGHSMIISAHIPGWKRPPIELAPVFEPLERFKVNKEVSADQVLFNFAEETIPVMVTNTGDEEDMIYKDSTLDNLNYSQWIKFKTLVHSKAAKVRN